MLSLELKYLNELEVSQVTQVVAVPEQVRQLLSQVRVTVSPEV